MNKIDLLKTKVEDLYKSDNPNAAPWKDWIYENHVLIVANICQELSNKYKAGSNLTIAGALLHDIGDTVMTRDGDEVHETKSLQMAEELLTNSDFKGNEVEFIVKEVITPHSCKEIKPNTLEGKILATADAMAHLTSDFYIHFCWTHEVEDELEPYKKWVLRKIERDFNDKIFFEEEKAEVKQNYKAAKLIFSK